MNVRESVEYLREHPDELEHLLEDLKVDLGEKKAAELTPYNLAEKALPSNFRRLKEELGGQIQRFSDMALVIREIVDRRERILSHFDATRRCLAQLDVPGDLQATIAELLASEANLQSKMTDLEDFRERNQVADDQLEHLMAETGPIDSLFFETLERVVRGLALQQEVVNQDYLQAAKDKASGSKMTFNETYEIAKRIALRKLSGNFEANFQQIIYDAPTLQTHLRYLSLNPEATLVTINKKVLDTLTHNLRQVFEGVPLHTPKSVLAAFTDLAPAIDFCFAFNLQFTSQLFKKFSASAIHFHSNIEALFGSVFWFLQAGTGAFRAQGSLKVEWLVVPEAVLRLKKTIKRYKPQGMGFSCEKILDLQVAELLAHFRKVMGSHVEKLVSIRNYEVFREQIFHAVTLVVGAFQFPLATRNEGFAGAVWEGLVKVHRHFGDHPDWNDFWRRYLGWLGQGEALGFGGQAYWEFAALTK